MSFYVFILNYPVLLSTILFHTLQILSGITDSEMDTLDAYENVEYKRSTVEVSLMVKYSTHLGTQLYFILKYFVLESIVESENILPLQSSTDYYKIPSDMDIFNLPYIHISSYCKFLGR